MASLSWDGECARVQFHDAHGKRHAVRLGACAKKVAETVRQRIGDIADARRFAVALDGATAKWLTEIDDTLHARMAAVGLCESRSRMTLAKFLAEHAAGNVGSTQSTKWNNARAAGLLIEVLGDVPMGSVTVADAERFRDALAEDLARATVGRHVTRARQFFRLALKAGVITTNPFTEVPGWPGTNPERQRFIDRPTIASVMATTTDAHWRTLIALSRFGGLRIVSEALGLRWADIDWRAGKIIIAAHKTARRVIPLFPELRTALEAQRKLSGTNEFVVTQRAAPARLWRMGLLRLIAQAGLTPWPRLWHNMRASRQTELAAEFPLHVVCYWLGNSEPVAADHYLTVRESDYARAAHLSAQQGQADDERRGTDRKAG